MQLRHLLITLCNVSNDAFLSILQNTYDAVILDIMLPGRDGLSIVQTLRANGNRTPILLVSGRGELGDRLTGLNAGADDYLPKPFALEELIARVCALIRRRGEKREVLLRFADLTLNPYTRRAVRGDREIALTNKEF
jgi:DNA-binding response OmpR family regulator